MLVYATSKANMVANMAVLYEWHWVVIAYRHDRYLLLQSNKTRTTNHMDSRFELDTPPRSQFVG